MLNSSKFRIITKRSSSFFNDDLNIDPHSDLDTSSSCEVDVEDWLQEREIEHLQTIPTLFIESAEVAVASSDLDYLCETELNDLETDSFRNSLSAADVNNYDMLLTIEDIMINKLDTDTKLGMLASIHMHRF